MGEDWKKRNTGEREEETEPGRKEQTTPGKMCPCPSAACSLAKLLSGSQRPASRGAEKDAGELLPPRSGKQSAAAPASGLPDMRPHCRAEACGSLVRKPCLLPLSQGRAPVGSVAQPDCRKRTSERHSFGTCPSPGGAKCLLSASPAAGSREGAWPTLCPAACPSGHWRACRWGFLAPPPVAPRGSGSVTHQGHVWFCLQFSKLLWATAGGGVHAQGLGGCEESGLAGTRTATKLSAARCICPEEETLPLIC